MKDRPELYIREVLHLMNREDYLELGKHPLANIRLVREQVAPSEQTILNYGKKLYQIIEGTIDSKLKPVRISNQTEMGQIYNLLKMYAVEGKNQQTIQDEIGIGRANYFKKFKRAIKYLAAAVETRMQPLSPNNLPARPYLRFIPRTDSEGQPCVEHILSILDRQSRPWIIAIGGGGGLGKTALAYEVASQAARLTYFDTVIWTTAQRQRLLPKLHLEERHISTVDDILNTIAETFKNRSLIALDPQITKKKIKNFLETHTCLLVIDGIEFFDDSELDVLGVFLRDYFPSPCKAILTSRRRDLVGMVPIKLAGMKWEESLQFMHMICEHHGISEVNDEMLEKIYEEFGGLPLAMEFILGQVRIYGPPVIEDLSRKKKSKNSRLGKAEEVLLTFIAKNSYKCLSSLEKRILGVMPLFDTSASPEAIAIASNTTNEDLNSALEKLYFLHLITHRQGRYEIITPTRIIIQKLYARDDTFKEEFKEEDAYLRLAEYYTQYTTDIVTDQQVQFLAAERENILAVLEWCDAHHRRQAVIDLVNLIGFWLGIWGHRQKRIEWGQRALNASYVLRDHQATAWIKIYHVGCAYYELGEWDRADKVLQDGLNLARRIGNKRTEGVALRNLAALARDRTQDFDEAKVLYEQALAIFEEIGDKRLIAMCQGGLGVLAIMGDDLVKASDYLNRAHKLNSELNDQAGLASNLSDLGRVATAQGDFNEAENLLQSALELSQSHELLADEGYVCRYLAKNWEAFIRTELDKWPDKKEHVRKFQLEELTDQREKGLKFARRACEIYARIEAGSPGRAEADKIRESLEAILSDLEALQSNKRGTS